MTSLNVQAKILVMEPNMQLYSITAAVPVYLLTTGSPSSFSVDVLGIQSLVLPVAVQESNLSWVWDFPSVFIDLHEVPVSPFLQPVKDPLNSSSTF